MTVFRARCARVSRNAAVGLLLLVDLTGSDVLLSIRAEAAEVVDRFFNFGHCGRLIRLRSARS